MNERLVHGEPAEVRAPAFDAFLDVELKAVPIKEGAGGKADVRGDGWNTRSPQGGFNAMIKPAGNAATSECRMRVQKVEVTGAGEGSEACDKTIRLDKDGVKVGQALPPAGFIRWNR